MKRPPSYDSGAIRTRTFAVPEDADSVGVIMMAIPGVNDSAARDTVVDKVWIPVTARWRRVTVGTGVLVSNMRERHFDRVVLPTTGSNGQLTTYSTLLQVFR